MNLNKLVFLPLLALSLVACSQTSSSSSNDSHSSSSFFSSSSVSESSSVSISTSYRERMPLKEVYGFVNEINIDNIKRVMSVNHIGSTAPNLLDFNTYYYSESRDDFVKVMDYLNRVEVIFNNPEPREGPGSKSLCVVLNRAVPGDLDPYESYSINALDQCIVINGVWASISEPLPSFNEFYAYSFSSQSIWNMTVKEGEQDVSSSFSRLNNLSYMLFNPIRDTSSNPGQNEYNKYTFSNPQGTIVFQNETNFVITTSYGSKAGFYIINGYTFKSLLSLDN